MIGVHDKDALAVVSPPHGPESTQSYCPWSALCTFVMVSTGVVTPLNRPPLASAMPPFRHW